MALLGTLLGIGIGGSVGLIVIAALLPQADTQIAANVLNNTAANTMWQLLPLFLVIVIVMAMIGGVTGTKI